MISPTAEETNTSNAPYAPAGYCPHCGYQIDPGRCTECGREVPRPMRVHPRVRRRRIIRMAAGVAALATVAWLTYAYGRTLCEAYLPNYAVAWVEGVGGPLGRWAEGVLEVRLWVALEDSLKRSGPEYYEIVATAGTTQEIDWSGVYQLGAALPKQILAIADGRVGWSCSSLLTPLYRAIQPYQPVVAAAMPVGSLKSDCIRLNYDFNRTLARRAPWPKELILVRWEDWRYLVPHERMADFCNAVNAMEPLYARFFTRPPRDATPEEMFRGRPAATCATLPAVPPAFRVMLLEEPLKATAINVRKIPVRAEWTSTALLYGWAGFTTALGSRITLDRGSDAGLRVGMLLYSVSEGPMGMGRVTTVEDDRATMIWIELGRESPPASPSEVGCKYSTRWPIERLAPNESSYTCTLGPTPSIPPVEIRQPELFYDALRELVESYYPDSRE